MFFPPKEVNRWHGGLILKSPPSCCAAGCSYVTRAISWKQFPTRKQRRLLEHLNHLRRGAHAGEARENFGHELRMHIALGRGAGVGGDDEVVADVARGI